jgi:adenylate kinase family enzyme
MTLHLQVPEEILVDRVVGRRLDPITGKIYHLKYSPPETQEIAARLTQRFDDTEEKVYSKSFFLFVILWLHGDQLSLAYYLMVF